MRTEHFGAPGVNGTSGYGNGGIGGLSPQQQVRTGFGRNNGFTPGRPILNQFNPQTPYTQNYNPYPTHRHNPEHPQLPQIPLPNQLEYQGPKVPQIQFSQPQMPQRNPAPPEPPQYQYTEQFTIPSFSDPPGMPWLPTMIVIAFAIMLYYTPEFSDCLHF
jgi:hypothetical protein